MSFYLAIFTTIIISEIYNFFYPKSLEEIMQIGEVLFNQVYDKTNHVLIGVSYNSIYYFSCCQIYYNKIRTFISYLYDILTKYTGLFATASLTQEVVIKIYNNGEIVDYKNTLLIPDNQLIITDQLKNCHSYDLILILMNDNNNIKCLDKTYNIEFPIDIKCVSSNVKFIAIEICYDNSTYSICLKNEDENYYIVGNVFNKDFFKYYLNNKFEATINNDIFDYKLSIIDHNANLIDLTPEQVIIIGENDYEIR